MIGSRGILVKTNTPVHGKFENTGYDLNVHTGFILTNGEKKYSVISLLGKGTFGQVFLCLDFHTKEYVAIKVAKSRHIYFECAIREAQAIERISKINNRLFVNIKNYFIFNQHFCAVLEVLGNNLYEILRIRKFKGFDHEEVRSVLNQLLVALVDMSRIGLVHCDLKPENILVTKYNTMEIKIIDFGSAFYHFKDGYFYVQSRYYRAPEVIKRLPYNSMVDVWSFGCIAYELLMGKPIFPGKNNVDQMNRINHFFNGETNDISGFLDIETARNMILEETDDIRSNILFFEMLMFVLKVNPLERPMPADILRHPYLGNYDFDSHQLESEGFIPAGRSYSKLEDPPENKGFRRFSTHASKSKQGEKKKRKGTLSNQKKP